MLSCSSVACFYVVYLFCRVSPFVSGDTSSHHAVLTWCCSEVKARIVVAAFGSITNVIGTSWFLHGSLVEVKSLYEGFLCLCTSLLLWSFWLVCRLRTLLIPEHPCWSCVGCLGQPFSWLGSIIWSLLSWIMCVLLTYTALLLRVHTAFFSSLLRFSCRWWVYSHPPLGLLLFSRYVAWTLVYLWVLF